MLTLFTALLLSCGSNKRKPVYVDTEPEHEDTTETPLYATSGDVVSVPYRSKAGVKYVPVKVNGMGVDMIFDTGCSSTLISMAEATYLAQKGMLSESDFIDMTEAVIADGSIVKNMVVNLREVVINDQILCHNVKATVSDNINAPLLLGNEVLDRVASITIDVDNQVINFKLR